MVVGDFDVEGVAILPSETNPKLVINSNAELPRPIGLQSLQTVIGLLSSAKEASSGPGESSSEETFSIFLSTTTGASVNRGSS